MYAVIDIETTGGSPVSERITEIAVYIHDGGKITDEFISLINPERKIPYHITNLTGITNDMVAEAPRFCEVARKIVEITDKCIFVAHNVSFDYQFIRHEYRRLGYEYSREKLCTVQLSRRLIPGLPSYSLSKLCRHLNINNNARHRAAGDALATVKLFEEILARSGKMNNQSEAFHGFDKKDLHPALAPETIYNLPEAEGVYYFYNDKKELIYIGKSKNIRTRVLSHLRSFNTRKSIEMRNTIAAIDYEQTGSELIALLKESHEIKRDKPLYNRSQRRALSQFGLYYYYDSSGYLNLAIAGNSGRNDTPLCSFATKQSGKSYLQNLVDEYDLCQKLCALYPAGGACFHYEIAECKGACIGKELPETYNLRARIILDKHLFRHESFFILDRGRVPDELAVVKIECGKYIGYGYIDETYYGGNLENLHACINAYPDNRDIQQILRTQLKKNRDLRILPYGVKFEQA
jgi:DNA polymerase-3 subunit epsilon